MQQSKYCMWIAGIQPETLPSFPFIQPGCPYPSPDCYFMGSAIPRVMPMHFSLNLMRISCISFTTRSLPLHQILPKPPRPEACNLGFLSLTGLSLCLPAFSSSRYHCEKENSEATGKMAELLTPGSRCLRTQAIVRIQEVRERAALEGSLILSIT